MAVADVYDALISRRSYKQPYTHEEALAVILEGRGRHFDPDVVDALQGLADACRGIAERYRDEDEA